MNVNALSLVIILSTFVVAGSFWAQHQNTGSGVHNKGNPLAKYKAEVKRLESKGDQDMLIERLIELVEASEEQHESDGCGVCPWFYERLAAAYNKHQQFVDELSTLQRFATAAHPKHPSVQRVLNRLNGARSDAAARGRKRIEEELLLRAARG